MLRFPSFARISSIGTTPGEAGFAFEVLIGPDNAMEVLVGEEALGAFASGDNRMTWNMPPK